jgi:hypothetical protein
MAEQHEHIPPHRAWVYVRDITAELSIIEHDHIFECDRCLRLFMLCVDSESFGGVLKQLGEDLGDRRSA